MSTIDPTGSDPVTEAPAAGPARMDVPTTQQMLREMTMLTNAMFSLLQPHRAPVPETATPEDAPRPPAVPPAAIVPAATAPVTSIPLPSLPVPDLPSPEPEPETADEEGQPEQDGRQSMALMNEIAFLDE